MIELRAAVVVRGTSAELTAEAVRVTPPPPPPEVDPDNPDTFPLNPNGYVPIVILEPQTPINEFQPPLP